MRLLRYRVEQRFAQVCRYTPHFMEPLGYAMSGRVADWLEQLGVGRYAEAFSVNAIEWAHLPDLDHDTLQAVGVDAVGHRMTILKAAAALTPSIPPTGTVSTEEFAASADRAHVGAAERRQLTVMFCDLVGSTELSQLLDPEDLREINRAYQDACKTAIERYEGYVARYMGDGVLAYFGYPLAHEDDAERSIHAGLGVVESVAALNPTAGQQRDIHLGVRVGIATGPVVVGDLIGEGASQESAVVGGTRGSCPAAARRMPKPSIISQRGSTSSAVTLTTLDTFGPCSKCRQGSPTVSYGRRASRL
jgi:hypothetical protein